MLNKNNLSETRAICKEVLALIAEVENEVRQQGERTGSPMRFGPNPSPNTAALRRRTMDLTRQLAKLRSANR